MNLCSVVLLSLISLIGAIASAFLTSISLGLITTIAIMLHEIPQELGDFGILGYGGFTRAKALTYNFISSLTSLVGRE